jgi:gas vesicle protein
MSKSNTVIALVAGAALGAAIGILYAPESGEKTRKKIKKQAKQAKKELEAQASKTYEQVSEKAAHISSTTSSKSTQFTGTLGDRIETAISSASYKADDAISALEDKLEQLRAQNAKLQKPSSSKGASKTETTVNS